MFPSTINPRCITEAGWFPYLTPGSAIAALWIYRFVSIITVAFRRSIWKNRPLLLHQRTGQDWTRDAAILLAAVKRFCYALQFQQKGPESNY